MKKMKYAIWAGAALLSVTMGMNTVMTAKAVNYNYVTIRVDAVDDSGSLQYAIDSDAPEAFSDKSSFEVVPGSTHTIYVKDLAGNVTSQVYSIPEQEDKEEPDPARQAETSVSESYDPDTDERKINIDVNLANGAFTTSGSGSAAEDGGGTLYDKERTDGMDTSGKVFYTVTTKEGEVFYLVVDQNRSDNNVYLLTQTTVNDLQHLADQNDYDFTIAATGQNSQSLLNMLSGNSSQGTEQIQQTGEPSAPAKSTYSNLLLVVLVVIAGGGYYIFRMKKNRREKQMDEIDSANDLSDYEIDSDDAGDELEFDEAPVDQEHPGQDENDEELRRLMKLNTEAVFGEEGETGAESGNEEVSSVPPLPAEEMGLDDYDEFGEEDEQ